MFAMMLLCTSSWETDLNQHSFEFHSSWWWSACYFCWGNGVSCLWQI